MIVNFRGVALLVAFSLTPLFAVGGWPMYLFDISHSSFNPSESEIGKHNVASLDVNWAIDLAAPIAAAPTISDGVAYVGAWDGNFYAIDTGTGAVRWSTFVGLAGPPAQKFCMPAVGVSSQAAVVGNVVYVGGGDSAVYALNKQTGSQVWRTALADPQSGAY